MCKAAFFDIDGTLVSFKTHCVPASAKRAIETLRSNGIKCFISSGRHLAIIDNLDDIRFDGYVTVNGGMTYYNGELIDSNPICPTDVYETLKMVYPAECADKQRIKPFAVSFVMKDGLVMNVENDKTHEVFDQLGVKQKPRLTDLRTVADQSVYQMISFFGKEEEAPILDILSNCESQRWSPLFSDLVPKGQSKVRGIKKLCDIVGADRTEIIAFGDGGNDIAMLRYAGLGVAMGNAADSVKQEADVVCPAVDDDGIEWVVKEVLHL